MWMLEFAHHLPWLGTPRSFEEYKSDRLWRPIFVAHLNAFFIVSGNFILRTRKSRRIDIVCFACDRGDHRNCVQRWQTIRSLDSRSIPALQQFRHYNTIFDQPTVLRWCTWRSHMIRRVGRYINNKLLWARKYARIVVRGYYLFREAKSCPRAKLEGNCELRGTDNVQGNRLATILHWIVRLHRNSQFF